MRSLERIVRTSLSSRYRPLLLSVVAACLLGATPHSAWPQTFLGGIRGTVRDAQGVIPGVTVSLLNEENGVSRETASNDVGEYSFPALPPGVYSLRGSVQGFKTFEREGLRIATQTFATIDILLEVGTRQETITVTASAPLINTANASHADVIDARTLEMLPSVGRNVFLMAVTVPTVQSSGDAHYQRMQDQSGASRLSIGGGGVRANNYLLDGFPITDLTNRASTNPSAEMVSDVRVQVHTYDAEIGRTGGGIFNTAARSGTNAFHGTGFFLSRPAALTGSNFFNAIRGIPTNDQYWRNLGGGVGGPLREGRTFFWLAGEMYRDGQAQAASLHVPTAAMRSGDFSRLTDPQGRQIPIYDPLTTDAAGNRRQFPGNIIPADRVNPVGRAYVSALPLPGINTDTDNGNFNYLAQDVVESKARQTSIKLDHNFSPSISLTGVYLFQTSSEPDANYFPQAPYAARSYQLDRKVNVFVANNTYILNPSTVATLRFGLNTFSDDNSLPFAFDTRTVPGINQAFASSVPEQKFPRLSLTGYAGTGFTGRSDSRYYSWGANGSVTRLHGSHSVKVGGDYRILGVDFLSFGESTGTYTFSGQFTGANANNPGNTGVSIADLLLGYPFSGSLPLNSRYDDAVRYYGAFVQDDWRITSRLTFNYGLRLEHETGLSEANNQLAVGIDRQAVSPLNVTIPADPVAGTPARQVAGGLIFAGVGGAKTHVGSPPLVKMSPRLGAAYRVNERTVLRGGYGLFWAPWQDGGQSAPGYSQTTPVLQEVLVPVNSIDNPFPRGLFPVSGNSLGLLTGVSSSVTFSDPDRTAPRVHQYSVDMERELTRSLRLGLTYMGSTGQHLTWGGSSDTAVNLNQVDPKYLPLNNVNGRNLLTEQVPNPFFGNPAAGVFADRRTLARNQLLRPFPQFGNINMTQSTLARSQYHAGVISLNKQTTGLWGGRISYTYSRLYDNQFGQANYYSSAPGILNHYSAIPGSEYYDLDAEYGRSRLDSPHKLAAAPIVRLPFGSGERWLSTGVPSALAGGWTVSLVVQLQSGYPLGVSQTVNNTNLLGAGQRPDVISGVEVLVSGDITDRLRSNPNDNLFLNPNAFRPSVPGTFGNAPRILDAYSPWRNSTDQPVELELTRDVGVEAEECLPPLEPLSHRDQQLAQAFEVERFGDVVEGTRLDRFDGGVDARRPGHEDHLRLRVFGLDLPECGEPVDAGRADADDRPVGLRHRNGRERFAAVGVADDDEAQFRSRALHDRQHGGVVVHDEQRRCPHRHAMYPDVGGVAPRCG